MKGVFGALRDASPDYWGRRVIEKHLGQTQLGEIDYLLHSPDDPAGALGFGLNPEPPAPRRKFNQTSARFLLEPDEAKKTIDEMEHNVKNKWYDIARREGVTEKDCEKIASAFAYPGFRLEIPA